MTQQTINVGAAPNDGTGDPARTAFQKVNANLADLYAGNANFVQSGTGAVTRTVNSKLQESVSVLDFGADPTGVADSTAAINAAIASLNAGAGGIIYFPPGQYGITSIQVVQSSLVQVLRFQGAGAPYTNALTNKGTRIFARGATAYMLQAYNCTAFEIRDMTLDGAGLAATVLDFSDLVGPINDYTLCENLQFSNCASGGAFVRSYAAGNAGGENALIKFINCTFQLHSGYGVSINLSNNNAWNWWIEKCNFFGTGAVGHVYAQAGDITFRDCEFENASTYDIEKWESAKVCVYNCRSQSPGQFMYNHQLVTEGTNWTRKRTVIENLYHFNVGGGPPSFSVTDDSGSPLKIDNLEGFGVQVNYTGSYAGYTHKEIDIKNTHNVAIGIGATPVDIQQFRSPATTVGNLTAEYDPTLTYSTFKSFETATNSFVTTGPQTYRGGMYVEAASSANLIVNGTFSTVTAPWIAGGTGGSLASVAGGHTGNCLQVTGTSYGYGYQTIQTGIGRKYRLTVWFKNGTTTGLLYVGNSAADNSLLNISVTNAAWTQASYIFTATANVTYVSLLGNASGTMLFDDVLLLELPLTVATDISVTGLPVFANNAAAIAGGLAAGSFYRTNADPDPVCVVH